VRSVSGRQITLATPYDFYQEKLNDPQNRLTIEEVFSKILELPVRISTITDRDLMPQNNASENNVCADAPEGHQDSLLSSALEIMGGKVVE
jgi:hypothetical protein